MASLSRVVVLGVVVAVSSLPAVAQAEVISGTMTHMVIFPLPYPPEGLAFGDGVNNVEPLFTLDAHYPQGEQSLFFYGSAMPTLDGTPRSTDVALAEGVTDILQITDASIYTLTSDYVPAVMDADCSPDGVGDFVVHHNIVNGHWGVIRVDDVYYDAEGEWEFYADLTWWFQTDGSANFAPEPGSLVLLAMGSLVVLRRRR